MKRLVLTGCAESMKSVGDLTAPIARRYAVANGYDFERIDAKEFTNESHPSWDKLQIVIERLDKYDVILWLDADSVVTNPFVWIHERMKGEGLTVSTDWSKPEPNDIAYFSTGNFIVTQEKGMEILKGAAARTKWKDKIFWDQSALQEEYRENEAIRPYVHILPRRELNAVPAFSNMVVEEPWEPGDFIAHLTNRSNEERVRIIQMR